jgi:hypothetical protein
MPQKYPWEVTKCNVGSWKMFCGDWWGVFPLNAFVSLSYAAAVFTQGELVLGESPQLRYEAFGSVFGFLT